MESWRVVQQTGSQRKGAKEPGGESEMSAGTSSQDAGAGTKHGQPAERQRPLAGPVPAMSSGPGSTGPMSSGLAQQLREGWDQMRS